MKKIIEYKNYLLGVIGILLALTMLVGVKYLMKPKYEELPEVKLVKLKDIKNNKSFAIMVQNGDGYEEYTSEDNTWPGSDYVFKEAKCTDNNGALVDNAVTFADGKAILTTNQTIYCTLYFDEKPKSTIEILRSKDKEISGIEHLGSEPGPEPDQVEMYRYQGTDNIPNWILFGTREKCEKDGENQCANLENMTYDEYVDKYMYRIIGITEEGQLYLIKETFLKEGTTNTFKWHNTSSLSSCLGENCEWPNADIYKRLNGETSNGNPIFVNSTQYEYLKSGDEKGTNDGIGSEWYTLIADHEWMYGDTNEYNTANSYNGDYMYGIETGNTATKRYWPDEEHGQTTCSDDSLCTEKPYTWSNSANNVKIGLMHMHDVDYAYADCSSGECKERGNPGSYGNVKNSWMHFRKDGYNTSSNYEWLITRFGDASTSISYVYARAVSIDGLLYYGTLNRAIGARPVFYLSSEARIADGDGTKDSPFILE